MREFRSSGSVRGALRKERPYRERPLGVPGVAFGLEPSDFWVDDGFLL